MDDWPRNLSLLCSTQALVNTCINHSRRKQGTTCESEWHYQLLVSKPHVSSKACVLMKGESLAREHGNVGTCIDRFHTMHSFRGTPHVKEQGTDIHIETSSKSGCLWPNASDPSLAMLHTDRSCLASFQSMWGNLSSHLKAVLDTLRRCIKTCPSRGKHCARATQR